MIGTFLAICIGYAVVDTISKMNDTQVKRGKDIFGHRYKKVSGVCHRCGGSGKVRGRTCHKCGGSGRFRNTTWYS